MLEGHSISRISLNVCDRLIKLWLINADEYCSATVIPEAVALNAPIVAAPAPAASGSKPKEDESLNNVDVTQLVFLDEEAEAPKVCGRSRSIASMSSAAVDEEVSGSSHR